MKVKNKLYVENLATQGVVITAADGELQSLVSNTGTHHLINTAGVLSWATFTSGTLTSVSGTTNRIHVDSTTPAVPVIDIDSNYAGQNTIATLGTVTTGTWHGDTVGVGYGGTGLNSVAAGSALIANASNTVSALTSTSGSKVLLNINGTISWSESAPAVGLITEKSANYQATTTDYVILVRCSTANITITLPATPIVGQQIAIKKIDTNSQYNVIVTAGGTVLIDNATSYSWKTINTAYYFIYDGTSWWII